MTSPILALILGSRTPAWDVPAPPDYPRRTLGWYLERARNAQAARQPRCGERLKEHHRVVREAQRIINEAPRDD